MINSDTSEILADRLNYEPIILRGATSSELGLILMFGVVFWVPFGFLAAYVFNRIAMGLGIAALGVLATVYYGASLFQFLKRGRPDYFYQQRLFLQLEQLGIHRSGFVRRTGLWDLGRSRRFDI